MNLGDIFTPITYNNPAVNPIVVGYNMSQPTILPFINFGGTSTLPSIGNTTTFGTSFAGGDINFGGGGSIWNGTIGANPFGDSLMPSVFLPQNNSYSRAADINFSGTSTTSKTSSTTSPTKTETKKNSKTATNPTKTSNQALRNAFVKNAKKYIGYKESDGSYKRFSNSPEWCADFVSYVIKEAYEQQGLRAPKWFGNHRVENLRKQAIEHDKYLCITESKDRTKTVKEKVRAGDIVIMREKDGDTNTQASHTGIVTKVYPNGTFDTIEGNVTSGGDDRVLTMHYSPYHKDISGFVQLP